MSTSDTLLRARFGSRSRLRRRETSGAILPPPHWASYRTSVGRACGPVKVRPARALRHPVVSRDGAGSGELATCSTQRVGPHSRAPQKTGSAKESKSRVRLSPLARHRKGEATREAPHLSPRGLRQRPRDSLRPSFSCAFGTRVGPRGPGKRRGHRATRRGDLRWIRSAGRIIFADIIFWIMVLPIQPLDQGTWLHQGSLRYIPATNLSR